MLNTTEGCANTHKIWVLIIRVIIAAAPAFLLLRAVPVAEAWDPWMLAQRPPMGFANWNGFGCDYNSSTIRAVADVMASKPP